MKTHYLTVAAVIFLFLTACKSTTVTPGKPTLVTKWNVVSDSTAFGCALLTTSNYIGTAGDYYDFRSNGMVYIKEGPKYDTAAYKIVSDNSVTIGSRNYGYPFVIEPFTATDATLYTGPMPAFTCITYEKIILKK